jgi:DNA polymerase beta
MNNTITGIFGQIIEQKQSKLTMMKAEAEPDKPAIKSMNFKILHFRKAIKTINDFDNEIVAVSDLDGIKGIGKGLKTRIQEILDTGTLQELKTDPKEVQLLKDSGELQSVTGIGPSKAYKLTKQNVSLKDLLDEIKKYKRGSLIIQKSKLLKDLTHHQIIGLKYYKDFLNRIPRKEIDDFNTILHKEIPKIGASMNKNIIFSICGSYRRKVKNSGDIDLLLTVHGENTIDSKLLHNIVDSLKKQGIIIDNLTELGITKYMGVCRVPKYTKSRRLDIRYVKYDSYIPALLYFTGSAKENVRLRNIAITKGYKINEYGFYKLPDKKDKNGKEKRLILDREEDLYELLDEVYKRPEDR